MKAGDNLNHEGEVYLAVLNLVQVLTQELSCRGCHFWEYQEDCPKDSPKDGAVTLLCGNRTKPMDEQVIFVKLELEERT